MSENVAPNDGQSSLCGALDVLESSPTAQKKSHGERYQVACLAARRQTLLRWHHEPERVEMVLVPFNAVPSLG